MSYISNWVQQIQAADADHVLQKLAFAGHNLGPELYSKEQLKTQGPVMLETLRKLQQDERFRLNPNAQDGNPVDMRNRRIHALLDAAIKRFEQATETDAP